MNWEALSLKNHIAGIKTTDPAQLLRDAEEAIRGNLQARACALVHHYGTLGHSEQPVFDLLLKYACSEDGALHAEKYYGTVREEFKGTRTALRWRHLAGLAASPPVNADAPPRGRRRRGICWAWAEPAAQPPWSAGTCYSLSTSRLVHWWASEARRRGEGGKSPGKLKPLRGHSSSLFQLPRCAATSPRG